MPDMKTAGNQENCTKPLVRQLRLFSWLVGARRRLVPWQRSARSIRIAGLLLVLLGSGFLFLEHQQKVSEAQTPVVSTHSNKGFAAKTEEDFELGCTQCHDFIHGGGTNLALIGDLVTVTGTIKAGPVVFTARTGSNSYDDGTSVASSRICVTCHINPARPGSGTAMSHTGGIHSGGNNFVGQQCTICHTHNPDGDPTTLDGFMPDRGCTICHAQAQDNGDGLPAGGRRAVLDEFGYSSHHVQGPVDDNDCKTCHEMATHTNGYVQLRNVDTGAVFDEETLPGGQAGAFRPETITNANSKTLQAFCLACHDENGANGNTTPFSDGVTVPNIEASGVWANSAHNTGETTNTGYGCLGDGANSGCHATAHGSQKAKLLAPANVPTSANNVNQEEGFCYTCHDGTPVATDIQGEFLRSSHHDVDDAEQAANSSAVECTNCHNPHKSNAADKLVNPDNTNQLWTGTDRDFCVACHDGNPPATVVFPGIFDGTGYNKTGYLDSAHDIGVDDTAGLKGFGCRHCHEQHGSNITSLLRGQYAKNDFNPYQTGDYALCWTCHIEDNILNDSNHFDNRHSRHVEGSDTPCIHCHDVHQPHDPGEPGLINLRYGVERMDINLVTADPPGGPAPPPPPYTLSNAFQISGGTGYCFLQCHNTPGQDNVDHSPNDYSRRNLDTIGNSCLTCHPGGVPVGAAGAPGGFQAAVSFGFNGPAGAGMLMNEFQTGANQATAGEVLTGVVNDPAETLPGDGYLHSDGVDNYIEFKENDTSLQASTDLAIELRLKPAGLEGTSSLARFIFDRGTDQNYRVALWRDNGLDTFNAPDGTASVAFSVKPVESGAGTSWKMVLTNYNSCPIVSDHWYEIKIIWDSGKPVGIPGMIYVDDQGINGDNTGENWPDYRNCTDADQSLLPPAMQVQTGDQIARGDSDFSIGTSVANPGQGLFEGLVDWMNFYTRQTGAKSHHFFLPTIIKYPAPGP